MTTERTNIPGRPYIYQGTYERFELSGELQIELIMGCEWKSIIKLPLKDVLLNMTSRRFVWPTPREEDDECYVETKFMVDRLFNLRDRKCLVLAYEVKRHRWEIEVKIEHEAGVLDIATELVNKGLATWKKV